MAGVIRSDPLRGASKLTGRSNVRTTEAPTLRVPREADLREFRECRAGQQTAKAYVDIPALELMDVEVPGVGEDGMSGRNGSESPEPLAGRLGAPAQRRHHI